MLELRDIRAKVTIETDCVIEALSRTTGRERSEIVREVLAEWAQRKIHESTVLSRLLASEGIAGQHGTPPK
jgi:hypothetical protein